MKCKNCSYENPPDRTVCLICGEPLPLGESQPAVEETIVMGPSSAKSVASQPSGQKPVSPPAEEKAVERTIKIEPKSPTPQPPKPVTPPPVTRPAPSAVPAASPKPAVKKTPTPTASPTPAKTAAPQKPAVPETPPVPPKRRSNVLSKIIILLVLGTGAYFGYDWWQYESRAGKILRSSASFSDCQRQFSQIDNQKFIRRCWKNKSDWLKAAAIRRAAELGLGDTVTVIKKELSIPNSEVVLTQALLSLGMVGTNQDISVISRFLKSNNSEIRLAAVEAIKMVGQEKDLALLWPLLSDKAENVRLAVIGIIKEKKSLAGSVDLIGLLTQEASPKVASELLMLIADRKEFNPRLLSAIVSRLESADFQVMLSSFVISNQKDIATVLMQNYPVLSGEVKLKTIGALTGVQNSELAKFLLSNFRKEKDLNIKLSQIRLIGQSGYSAALPVLKNILRVEKNPHLKKEIVLAIARLKK